MEQLIRVLVVDDHTVVRKGLCSLLTSKYDIEVVGEAADGVEAVEKALDLQPDVILMDLMMPREDGLEAILEIKDASADELIHAIHGVHMGKVSLPANTLRFIQSSSRIEANMGGGK